MQVGDTLRISGTGMCNIRTPVPRARKPIHLFHHLTARRIIWNDARSLPLPESELVNKATALATQLIATAP
ncbi:IgaA/UmoB family intracellular growth attenuator [Shigella sonnei]